MSVHDLHCHSRASDGALTPEALVARAAHQGVTTLALTDHDSVAGLERAAAAARAAEVCLIPGIELSVSWGGQCIHIVGLGIDPGSAPLQAGIAALADVRYGRAAGIGRKLAKLGFPGVHAAALELAGEGMITRTHFARALVLSGAVHDDRAAFERYLARGKPAFVRTDWAGLEDALAWIGGSGGVAVVAHPRRYGLTASRLRAFLEEFRAAGGRGIEVVCGNSTPEDVRDTAQLARRFDLLASRGSDFHTPEHVWLELGRLAPLPEDLRPVWSFWE
ncbi:MAG TPA: PHP domain-containing protein [Methylococcaceae bacterium]|nr:PHP domain-containing protein [Methylococcaceae bacterium]